MSGPKQRNVELERRWREMLADFARSGLSIRAFCARRRISEPSFYFWRRELSGRDAGGVKAASPRFVPLTVVPGVAIEVALPNGVTVRVPAGGDEALVVRLITALAPSTRAASC